MPPAFRGGSAWIRDRLLQELDLKRKQKFLKTEASFNRLVIKPQQKGTKNEHKDLLWHSTCFHLQSHRERLDIVPLTQTLQYKVTGLV